MSARLTSESELETHELIAESGTSLAEARVIGVLGMHRSGTSLVAGLITNAGVSPGLEDTLFAGDRHNATGYFEQREVVALNDEILARAGASWWAPPSSAISPRPEWVARAREVAETVGITGRDQRLAVFKDPRASLTWPVWTQALRRNVFPLLVLRHPVDVARSLWLRDSMPLPVGLALWEHYICALLKSLGEQEAQVVHYDALTNQPGEALRWLTQLLDATGSDDASARAEAACDRLLRVNDATRTLHERSSGDVLTQHQQNLWSILAAVPNGTSIHPNTMWPQFQLSMSSRDTLAAYAERTERLVAQARELEEVTAKHAHETRRMDEGHRAALSELSDRLAVAELAHAEADELRAILSAEREDQRRKDASAADLASQVAVFRDKASRLELACEQLRGSAGKIAGSHREALTRLERALGELAHMHNSYLPVKDHEELVARLRAEIHQLGTEQHLMHESRTWRAGRALLAPFRLLGSLFRRPSTNDTPTHV